MHIYINNTKLSKNLLTIIIVSIKQNTSILYTAPSIHSAYYVVLRVNKSPYELVCFSSAKTNDSKLNHWGTILLTKLTIGINIKRSIAQHCNKRSIKEIKFSVLYVQNYDIYYVKHSVHRYNRLPLLSSYIN